MKYLHIISVIIVLSGCIQPYETDYKNTQKEIVIAGSVTTEQVPHLISVMETFPVDYSLDNPNYVDQWIEGATVQLKRGDGQTYLLEEVAPGRYMTDTALLKPQVGETYQLLVSDTPYGDFVSLESTILPPVEIDSISYEYNPYLILNAFGNNELKDLFDFKIHFELPSVNTGFRYEWLGLYEYRTQLDGGCNINLENPVTRCFIEERSNGFLRLFNPRGLPSGYAVDGYTILSLDPNRRFQYQYDLEIRQLSIDENAMSYWEKIATTYEEIGGLFDPIPSSIRGNIYNVDQPDQYALGYFEVASISKRRVTLYESQMVSYGFNNYLCSCEPFACRPGFTGQLPPPPDFCCDCRSFEGSRYERPAYWDE